MARQNHGPLSRAKGKLGGVVYQQYEGMQISREYQPVVKNPQTTKQVENRAKFKLSSQLVAQFKEVFNARLGKLSIYTRTRRATSVNAIYSVVDDGTPSNPQALLESVVAAVNAKSMSEKAAPAVTASSASISIAASNGNQVIAILCEYDAEKGELLNRKVETYTSNSTQHTISGTAGRRLVGMAVSLEATTEAGRATISNVTANTDGWQNEIARSAAAGDLVISNIGAAMFNPS